MLEYVYDNLIECLLVECSTGVREEGLDLALDGGLLKLKFIEGLDGGVDVRFLCSIVALSFDDKLLVGNGGGFRVGRSGRKESDRNFIVLYLRMCIITRTNLKL